MRTRSQSRNNFPQQEASPVIVEPLRIEFPFLEDQFQEDPLPESPMVDNRTMAQLLQAPTEGWKLLGQNASRVLQNNREQVQSRQSRAKAVVAKVGTSSSTLVISSDVAELKDMVALLLDKKNQSSVPTPSTTHAPVKAVESNCVTCGAAANYNQGNTGFRPQMVANEIRPPGFPPHQNNQNNFNQNRGGNFNQSNFNPSSFNQGQLNRPQVNQAPVYQAPIPQTQRVSQTDFKIYVKSNDAILRNMQSQGQSTQNQCQNIQNQYQNLQNQMATLTDMMTKLVSANTASSSGSGTLPGNTVTNPKEELK
nr:hypothetical protein [Tanacetum cinerariifolium]